MGSECGCDRLPRRITLAPRGKCLLDAGRIERNRPLTAPLAERVSQHAQVWYMPPVDARRIIPRYPIPWFGVFHAASRREGHDGVECGQDGVHPPRRQISLEVSEKQPRPKPVNGLLRGPFPALAPHCPAPVPHCAARVRHSCRTSPVSHANIIQRRRPMSPKAVPQDLARRSYPRRSFADAARSGDECRSRRPRGTARSPGPGSARPRRPTRS